MVEYCPLAGSPLCDIIVMGFRLWKTEDNSDGDDGTERCAEPLQEQEALVAGELFNLGTELSSY